VNFATFVLPLLSYAVLVPLTLLARRIGPRELSLWPAVLYVTAAAPSLITLHLDQALYPLLAVSTWALAVTGGASERAWAWGVAAGVVTWLGLFVSFSLAPIVPLAVAFTWLGTESDRAIRARQTLTVGGGMIAAFAVLAMATRAATGYDMIARYQAAMAHHRAWKNWTGAATEVLGAAGLNTVEFLYWLGIPTAALLVGGAAAGAAALARRGDTPSDAMPRGHALIAVTTVATLLATALTGNTKGEVARLWIFLVPAVALAVTATCARLAGARADRLLMAVAGASAVWAVLFKAKQDFW
jgi:hypothetical protein